MRARSHLIAGLGALWMCAAATSACAQGAPSERALVVPSCGAPPYAFVVGTYQPPTQNTLGLWCTNGSTSGGTGGGTASNALPPQGVTMTTTNPTITGGATPSAASLAYNSSRKYLQIANEGAQACRMGYGSDPGTAGGMPLPANGGQTLEASAITFQSIWFRCPATSQIDITEGQ